MTAPEAGATARRLTVAGRVQSVGYRPFVRRLAQGMGLSGWVRNLSGRVAIHAEGAAEALDRFQAALIAEAPPLARPRLEAAEPAAPEGGTGFAIAPSDPAGAADIHLPPDGFLCAACLAEMSDPANRRFRHPFITCTQCGPRYTLITALPYDRPSTTMAGFAMCPACRREYEDPLDRRLHAQPIACPECGPRLWFREGARRAAGDEAALRACVETLRAGRIAAVKGVGGYHLLCDARDAAAVARLRARKRRPEKPLAVLFPLSGADGLAQIRARLRLDAVLAAALTDPARPIVLAPRRGDSDLAEGIAPGLGEIGAFLPYSPLHHLLTGDFGAPLVATSANPSGEPVLTEAEEVEARLGAVADAFLHHDRPIARPADDSVLRPIAGAARLIRPGRGIAPLELEAPWPLAAPALALGGQMKAAIALGWGRRVALSPHIGDLDSPRALDALARAAEDLPRLYGVRPETLLCDAHPGYASHRWARREGRPVATVGHHVAHASALAIERPEVSRWLVLAWDGVGYGADGTLWGGEALLGRPGAWRRVGSWRPFRPIGGDRAAREPWRSAAALLWAEGRDFPPGHPGAPADRALARRAWAQGLNAPETSAVGRLFDAAACLILGLGRTSYEGQGPMALEALAAGAEGSSAAPALARDAAGVLRLDFAPLLDPLLDAGLAAAERAAGFHAALAAAALAQIRALAAENPVECVGLAGGVFQNRLLTETLLRRLGEAGFAAATPLATPANDSGLALGQLVEHAARCGRGG